MWKQLKDASMKVGYVGGWCLKYVQDAYGTDHPYPTAMAAWKAETSRHLDEPPLGITVPVYLSLGNEPAGHVAIRLSDGYVASSTQAGSHTAPYYHKNLADLIAVYGKYNGGAKYLGWGEHVGTAQVVQWQSVNATDAEISALFMEILERPAETEALVHYRNYTATFVRQDLYDSAEFKALQKHKEDLAAAQAADAAAKQAAADALAKAEAEAVAKAKADEEARLKALEDQKKATEAATIPAGPTTKQNTDTLYVWVVRIGEIIINWLKSWRKV